MSRANLCFSLLVLFLFSCLLVNLNGSQVPNSLTWYVYVFLVCVFKYVILSRMLFPCGLTRDLINPLKQERASAFFFFTKNATTKLLVLGLFPAQEFSDICTPVFRFILRTKRFSKFINLTNRC